MLEYATHWYLSELSSYAIYNYVADKIIPNQALSPLQAWHADILIRHIVTTLILTCPLCVFFFNFCLSVTYILLLFLVN